MKIRKILLAVLVTLVCCTLAFAAEKTLNRTVDKVRTEVTGEQVFQLFPGPDTEYFRCVYRNGLLTPTGEDPQMIWHMDQDLFLYDFTIRFSSPLEGKCDLQLFYDTGAGFSQEESIMLTAETGDTLVTFPLEPGYYRTLRLDAEEEIPLDAVDCACDGTVVHEEPGAFRIWRCAALFLLLLIPGILYWLFHVHPDWRQRLRGAAGFFGSDPVFCLLEAAGLSVWITTYAGLSRFTDLRDLIRCILHPNAVLILVLFCVFYGATVLSRKKGLRPADWLYRWRWAVAAAVLILAVAFGISGSSLHLWSDYLYESGNDGVLLGVSRAIRSDEWAHSVPMLSALDYEGYPVYSTLLRGDLTETVLTSGKTAWDISAIYRPFTWGYLLLGLDRGISFDWVARFVLLFMLTFDLGMLMLKNRKLSLALTCALVFSPVVQWWFYTPITDMLIGSFALVLAGRTYLLTRKLSVKLLCAAAVLIAAGNYVLTIYPAWVVPFAYLILGLFIWILMEERKRIRLKLKTDLPVIGGALLFFGGTMLFIFTRSAPALQGMTNTVYPGAVRVNSALSANVLFSWVLNVFSPFTNAFVGNSNVCETSGVLMFFPMGLLLSLYGMIRQRKADGLCVVLWILSLFFGVFTFLDVPDWLRTVTLMSLSMSGRIMPCFALTQLLLLFRAVSLLRDRIPPTAAVIVSAILSWFIVSRGYMDPLRWGPDAVFVGLFLLCLLVMTVILLAGRGEKWRRLAAGVLVMLSLMTGGVVNPVRAGISEISDSALLNELRQITGENPEGKWLVENLRYPYAMLPLMAGAPTINSANNYPDLERWEQLDPEKDDEYYYNRYVSQITVNLVDEETRFLSGDTADQFTLYLNPADLERLDVTFLFSNQNLEAFSTEQVRIERILSRDMFNVYRVWYPEKETVLLPESP